jgi:hypothetical protein
MTTKNLERLPLEDGETVELLNGKKLRLKVSPDYYTDLNDFDYLGRVEWSKYSSYSKTSYIYDRNPRPDGFNGNAEIIDVDRGSSLWWQPPQDVARGSDQFKALRILVKNVVNYGFNVFTLELLDGKDGYGRDIVAKYSSLAGLEPFLDELSKEDILQELLSELGELN